MSSFPLDDYRNKTLLIHVTPNAKIRPHNIPIESSTIIGRLTAINDNTITLRDSENAPFLLSYDDIQRVTPLNRDRHIKFMLNQLEYKLIHG